MIRVKNATRDNGVPGDVLKLLGEDDLRIMKQLINNVCENGEWPKVCNKFKMIAFKEKPKPTNQRDLRTICLVANSTKIVGRILKRRIERKTEDVFQLDNFNFFVLFFIRAIFKLYICIPTNCTQLIYFIKITLKHMYCLKL